MKKHFLPLSLLLVALGCQTDSAPAEDMDDSSGDTEAAVEVLPTPFTAEEIRGGCMPGTQVVFRLDVKGQPPMKQFMRFTEDDGENATVVSWMESTDGQPLGPRNTQVTAWSELRDHALLPEGTKRERASVTVEQGTHEGWHYVEPIKDERGEGTRSYWFADRFPGPPVLLVEVIGEEEVMRLELIARVMP